MESIPRNRVSVGVGSNGKLSRYFGDVVVPPVVVGHVSLRDLQGCFDAAGARLAVNELTHGRQHIAGEAQGSVVDCRIGLEVHCIHRVYGRDVRRGPKGLPVDHLSAQGTRACRSDLVKRSAGSLPLDKFHIVITRHEINGGQRVGVPCAAFENNRRGIERINIPAVHIRASAGDINPGDPLMRIANPSSPCT